MNKPQLIVTCAAAALLPAFMIVSMNYEKLVVEDRQLGTLLFFTENT